MVEGAGNIPAKSREFLSGEGWKNGSELRLSQIAAKRKRAESSAVFVRLPINRSGIGADGTNCWHWRKRFRKLPASAVSPVKVPPPPLPTADCFALNLVEQVPIATDRPQQLAAIKKARGGTWLET
jgi:hypothetical protein